MSCDDFYWEMHPFFIGHCLLPLSILVEDSLKWLVFKINGVDGWEKL